MSNAFNVYKMEVLRHVVTKTIQKDLILIKNVRDIVHQTIYWKTFKAIQHLL